MNDIPSDLNNALQALFRGGEALKSKQEPQEPRIKKEEIPEGEIRTLLQELETPQAEIEKTVQKIHAILELTEEDLDNNTYPEIKRMTALTEERARLLPRFETISTMIYRDYVGLHSKRIELLIGFNRPLFKEIFGEEFNDHYATLYAGVHDILEGISPFGDIPTPIKKGLSPRSNKIMNIIERKLGEILIRSYPLVHPEHEYDRAMLEDMISKKTLESQVVSYFDKLDGFLACFHEIIAGNEEFRIPFSNYINIFKEIKSGESLPTLQKYILWEGNENQGDLALLNQVDSIIEQGERIDDIFGECDTTESMEKNIDNDFGFAMYGVWKNFVKMIPSYDTNGIIGGKKLLTQRGRTLNPPVGLYE